MPRLNPARLTPASIVTFVLDASTRKKFNEREHYRKNPDRKNKVKIIHDKFNELNKNYDKERYEKNKATIKQKQKEYYEEHKTKFIQKSREYYLKNREHLDELNKKWKKNHKDVINASNKKYRDKLKKKNGVCGCGASVIYMARHLKSKKHIDWAAANDPICQIE